MWYFLQTSIDITLKKNVFNKQEERNKCDHLYMIGKRRILILFNYACFIYASQQYKITYIFFIILLKYIQKRFNTIDLIFSYSMREADFWCFKLFLHQFLFKEIIVKLFNKKDKIIRTNSSHSNWNNFNHILWWKLTHQRNTKVK